MNFTRRNFLRGAGVAVGIASVGGGSLLLKDWLSNEKKNNKLNPDLFLTPDDFDFLLNYSAGFKAYKFDLIKKRLGLAVIHIENSTEGQVVQNAIDAMLGKQREPKYLYLIKQAHKIAVFYNIEGAQNFNDYLINIDANYVFESISRLDEQKGILTEKLKDISEKILYKKIIDGYEEELVFMYITSIWVKFLFSGTENPKAADFSKTNFKEKISWIKEYFDQYNVGRYFVILSAYFSKKGLATIWSVGGSYDLTSRGKSLLEVYFPKNLGLVKKNFYDEIRIIANLVAYQYYLPLFFSLLREGYLEKINREIEMDYREFSNWFYDIARNNSNKTNNYDDNIINVKDKIYNIVSKNKNNIFCLLLSRVLKNGIDYGITDNGIDIIIKLKNVNDSLFSMISNISSGFEFNGLILHKICLIESNYGLNKNTSTAGALPPAGVMPDVYEALIGEKLVNPNYKQVLRASILELKKIYNLMNYTLNDNLNDEQLVFLAVAYNAGPNSINSYVRNGKINFVTETYHYIKFLIILHKYVKLV